MKIAVLGGGNGAYAAAADLALHGHEVSLWRRDAQALAVLGDPPAIQLLDHDGERAVSLVMASGDIDKVVTDAQLVVFPGPAFAQIAVANALATSLRDGQVVFLPPGTFGSYVMLQALRAAGCRADVTFAETGTLPYLARKRGTDRIAIARRATRLPTGMFPRRNRAHAHEIIAAAYPAIEPCEDALSGALMNAGPIIHPPLITMNAGPIEHFEHWDIHNEGTQPSVRAVTNALDAERVAVREAAGYGPPHFPLADHYASDGDEWMYGRGAHAKLTDSGDWREALDLKTHRYMREDVALGLSFLVSVGAWANVPTPVASGLLALGGAICGEDWPQEGRTLSALGLAHLSIAQMHELMEQGL